MTGIWQMVKYLFNWSKVAVFPARRAETTAADVLASLPFAEEAAAALGLPLKMTAVHDTLLNGPEGEALGGLRGQTEVFSVKLFKKSIWQI